MLRDCDQEAFGDAPRRAPPAGSVVRGCAKEIPSLRRMRCARPFAPGGVVPVHGLSPREIEVLRAMVDGKPDVEIADELGISRRTVATHLQSVTGKLGISSRAAASAWAVRIGLA